MKNKFKIKGKIQAWLISQENKINTLFVKDYFSFADEDVHLKIQIQNTPWFPISPPTDAFGTGQKMHVRVSYCDIFNR